MIGAYQQSLKRSLANKLYFLPDEGPAYFPHPFQATPEGVLAIGGNLHVNTLLNSYAHGIFPWYNEGEPIIWWFTSPRCILYPSEVKISKSMRQFIRNSPLSLRIDTNFRGVMKSCQTVGRIGQEGTWITQEMLTAYQRLHEEGFAHSIEVWEGEHLVGGLYGVSIGRCFFGESMFSKVSNASKLALVFLSHILKEAGYYLIDCQQETEHLLRMGAQNISRESFWEVLTKNKSHGLSHHFPTEASIDDFRKTFLS